MITNNVVKSTNSWKRAIVTFMLIFLVLFIYPTIGIAYSPLTMIVTTQIPLFIKVFLVIMAFMVSLDIAMISGIKKIAYSTIWDYLLVGHIFCFLTVFTHASLIYKLYFLQNIPSSLHYILVLSASLYIITHAFIYFVIYYLINPIAKKKLNLFSARYLLFYVIAIATVYGAFNLNIQLSYPSSPNFIFFYLLILFLFSIIIYFCIVIFSISGNYAKIGFVREPFLFGGIGGTAFALSVGLMTLYCFKFVETTYLPALYYYISFYLVAALFAMIYHLKFIIDYPSLIQPKWKVLMPFDILKVAATITLAFLAASFYFTAKEYPNFIIYQNIPYVFVVAFLIPVFFGTILILTYLNTISAKTKLKYWGYLKYGLYLHIAITFYVLSLIFISWDDVTSSTKMLCTVLVLVAFAFYMSFALDLRTILKDQNIKPIFDRIDFSLYPVSFGSFFILIFLGVSFSYGKSSVPIGIEFISYPIILFFIFFFLIAFGAYLSATHKGFEEIMRKNIWSELSYIFAFIVFLLVYLIYSSLSTYLQLFPYHNFAFIGYFAVLIIEIVSTSTLARKSKYGETRKEDVVHLLNFHAHHFLRTDYLENLWEKTVDRYVTEDEVKKIRFDPSERRFDLEETDEKTRLTIAVGILLGMQKLPNVEKITILRKSIEETKEDVAAILKEKILLLPDDLRSEFDESVYYPILYERAINDLLTSLETFIPFTEQANIFERLKRRDERFKRISFEVDKIRVEEGTRFYRDGFLELFRLYLDAVEEKFPFKRLLLYELVRETIKMELEQYNITVGEVLNMVPTGLEEMDTIMAGGLVKGSTTLLIAEETKMKQKILLSFIKQGLVEGNSAIYATSKRPFQQIIGELLMDVEALKNFVIIDLYEDLYAEGRMSELVEEEHRIIAPLSKILFQRSIVKAVKSQPRDVPKIVIGDVYDDFARYYSTKEIFEILQNQIEGLKRWNCTSVTVLDPHSYLITREGIEEVKKLFDNVLTLSGEEKDASVFIEKLYHGTPSKRIIRLHW
ncbi:hypothetical protein C5S30_02225 [ANME-1 cluster archaeon GoMg4]|nr:hypothetical protein [ANME-1 cluster archaeon GoMg4]